MSVQAATSGLQPFPERGGRTLALLNGFELCEGGTPVELPLTAQRLVAFVALQDRRVLRVLLAGRLWPGSSQPRASASLRSALWRVQRAGCDALRVTPSHIEVAHDLTVDVDVVATTARRVLDRTRPLRSGDADTIRTVGDVLPDWYDEWLVGDRERFRQLRLHALEALCGRLGEEGRFGEALEAGLAAVAAEPLRESAHRAVVALHLAEGNLGEAQRHYDAYRLLALRRLGVEPSARLRGLLDAQFGATVTS